MKRNSKGRVLRLLLMALVLLCLCLMQIGCQQKLGINGKRRVPLPDDSASVIALTYKTSEEQIVEETSSLSALSEEEHTLEDFKNKAVEDGFPIGELFDFQKQFAEGIVGGFNVQIGDYYMPVMEFSSQADAEGYASAILSAGYNLPIVSGRFLAMVSADSGVVRDVEQQRIMETIMGEAIWKK